MADGISGDEHQLVVFELANEVYGVEIGVIREIIRMQRPTRIPHTANHVMGVINLRGKVTAVVDMRILFGLPPGEQTGDTRILIANTIENDEDANVGVIVDAVTEVIMVDSASISPVDSIMTVDTEYIMGVAKMEERLIILLDVRKALNASGKSQAA